MSTRIKVQLLTLLGFMTFSLYACVLAPAAAAAAAASAFKAPRHEPQSLSLSLAETYSTVPAESYAASLTEYVSDLSSNAVPALEDSLHRTSTKTLSVQTARNVKKKEDQSTRMLSSPARRIYFWLLLVMIAGLFTTLKRRPAAVPIHKEKEEIPLALPTSKKKEQDIFLFEEEIIKGRERVKKVKGLLPAAKRLTVVLESTEAGDLLTTVENELNAAESHKQVEALDSSLTNALSALQQLHQRAVEHAKKLLPTDTGFVGLKEMKKWTEEANSAITELQHRELQHAVSPFILTVRSVVSDTEKFAEIMEKTGKGLSAGEHKFINEDDQEILFATAHKLECLHTLNKTTRFLFDLANQSKKCTLETVKAVLITERKAEAWEFDMNFAPLSLKHAIAKSLTKPAKSSSTEPLGDLQGAPQEALQEASPGALLEAPQKTPQEAPPGALQEALLQAPQEAPQEAPQGILQKAPQEALQRGTLGGPQESLQEGPGESSKEELLKKVNNLEKQLIEAGLLAGQLEESVESLKSSSSLQAAVDANAHIVKLLEAAEASVIKGAAAAADITLPEEYDVTTENVHKRAISWLEQYTEKEKQILLNIIERAEKSFKRFKEAISTKQTSTGEDLIDMQKEFMNQAAKSALEENEAIAAAVARYKSSSSLDDVDSSLKNMLKYIKMQLVKKKGILLGSQKFTFLKLIQNNLNAIGRGIEETESGLQQQQQLQLQGRERAFYVVLKIWFERAKDEINNSFSLEKAADLAADARAAAADLYKVLFDSDK